MKLRATLAAILIAVGTSTNAGIFDYEAMHTRLAAVLGSRAEADRVFNRLMEKATQTHQPIENLVDFFITMCMASDQCMK